MNEKLINLQSITKVFFTKEVETTALDNIHLSIDKGEYVSISGPSGVRVSSTMAAGSIGGSGLCA